MGTESILPALLTIASEVFGTEVSASANFFDLGGSSVSAVQLVIRLEEHLEAEIDIADLVSTHDFEEFAARLSEGIDQRTRFGEHEGTATVFGN